MKDAAELIARLRAATMGFDWSDLPDDAAIPAVPLLREAADHIETLEARVATLSKALEASVIAMQAEADTRGGDDEVYVAPMQPALKLARTALAAREASR